MTTKIAVSLPDELVAAARAAVARGEATSVSAWIAEAMMQRNRTTGLADFLAAWDAEHGTPGPADDAWARDQLGLATE